MKILNKTIKSIAVASLVLSSVSLYAETLLEESTTVDATIGSSTVGQLVSWDINNQLTSIEVVPDVTLTDVTLKVYADYGNGCDNSTNLIHTQNVNLTDTYTDNTNYSYQKITLDNPIDVSNPSSSNTSFMFCFSHASTTINLARSNSDVYAVGKAYYATGTWGLDFAFKAYGAPPNQAPTFTTTQNDVDVNVSSEFTYEIGASDPNNDDLSYSVQDGLSNWLNFTSGPAVSTYKDNTSAADMVKDTHGNIFYSSGAKIVKIATNGTVTDFAGQDTKGAVNAIGTAASFNMIRGIAIDSNDNIYVSDSGAYYDSVTWAARTNNENNLIRKITPDGNVTTFAGAPIIGTDDPSTVALYAEGPALESHIYDPMSIVVDSNDNVFVGTAGSYILKISDGNITKFAGNGVGSDTDGVGTEAQVNSTTGMTIDANDNIYITQFNNHTIRKITPDANVTTIAGTSGSSATTDGVGADARFNRPQDITYADDGNLYVTDAMNNNIRKVTLDGNVSTIAGIDTNGSVDGNLSVASFYYPYSILTKGTDIYIGDMMNRKIRKISSTPKVTGTPTCSDIGTHDVNLTVSDGDLNATQNFTITVADGAGSCNATPTDINLTSYDLPENSAIGTTIGELNATDADSGDTLTFSKDCSSAGVNDGNFTLTGTTLKSNYVFDYETTTTQSVCIKVNDGTVDYEENLTVNITNVNEMPSFTTTQNDVDVNVSSEFSYDPQGTDIDGDVIAI